MENFVVSARKYRPSAFDSVIGQEHITQTLKNAIRNKQLAHAFLFCGPRGVGKTTCARILAKTINCENITADTEACGECDSCRAFTANASFNIYELDAASNNSVDDIRGLVEQVRYPPQGAKYKIYIIDEVHMLSAAAFNAFLKTLEEPPPYAKFILATTEKHKILPTILSRCQVFDFHRITIEHAVTQLKTITANEGITAEDEALHVIAQKADGAMRDALSIFDRIVSFSGKNITYKDVILNLNILDYDYYFRALDMMHKKDVSSLFLLFDEVLSNGFDAQHFLSGLNEHIRNLLMCKYPNTIKLLEVAPSVAKRFMEQSSVMQASLLMNAMNLVSKCEIDFRMSRNQRLHVELTLLKLCHIQSVIDLRSAEDDKKKRTDLKEVDTVEEKKPEPLQVKPVVAPTVNSTPPPPPSAYMKGGSVKSQLEKFRLAGIEKKEEVPAEKLKDPEPEHQQIVPLTEALFTQAWAAYLQQLQSRNKVSLAAQLKTSEWKVKDENTVQLILASTHEKELFDEDRLNGMPYLRSVCKNTKLEIEIQIVQQTSVKTAFTADDRFKLMAENNPAWTELRNTLGLELEY